MQMPSTAWFGRVFQNFIISQALQTYYCLDVGVMHEDQKFWSRTNKQDSQCMLHDCRACQPREIFGEVPFWYMRLIWQSDQLL